MSMKPTCEFRWIKADISKGENTVYVFGHYQTWYKQQQKWVSEFSNEFGDKREPDEWRDVPIAEDGTDG